MIDRGREKRRADTPLPGAPRPRRRRGLWLMIGLSLVIFVVIVVFETRQEMARQRSIEALEGGAGDTPRGMDAAAASGANAEPVTLLGRLKEHYRAHDLPLGWTVGRIDAPTEAAATIGIVFSPSPQDSRYGQSAPADDIAKGAFCPEGSQFWSGLEDRQVAVELSDKSGVIKTLACAVARD